MSCPNNKDGQHNYQMKTSATVPPIVIRVCILCGAEG